MHQIRDGRADHFSLAAHFVLLNQSLGSIRGGKVGVFDFCDGAGTCGVMRVARPGRFARSDRAAMQKTCKLEKLFYSDALLLQSWIQPGDSGRVPTRPRWHCAVPAQTGVLSRHGRM